MTLAYYNENDPFAAAWLRKLITKGLIADGTVDDRSIVNVCGDDLEGFNQCHFFAGIGGWSLALSLARWPEDREVWTGSCPCQPFSAIGWSAGFDDARHLWPHFHRLIRERRPATVFGEQVASPDGVAWLDTVCTDMETSGYAIGSTDLCAAGVGAPHARQRLWFVAERLDHAIGPGLERHARHGHGEEGRPGTVRPVAPSGAPRDPWACEWINCRDEVARPIEPGTFPLADGVPNRVGLLRAYGNAVVPQVAAEVIGAFMECRP